jgi:hypothetical protein
LYKCKFLLQSKVRSDTDPDAKAEIDSQCTQIHEMLLLEKLASYSPVTENEPNFALEEMPEKLCDNDSDSIISYHSRKPGFLESDNGEPLTLCCLC